MAEPRPVDDLFDAARRVVDPEVRRAYLERACAGDDALHARVEALLRAHEHGGAFLESPAAGERIAEALDSLSPPLAEGPGSQVGPYRLLEPIGEGGFGVVYMAEQTAPVRRRVALKLLKPGVDTRQVIARFEAERQALALMDHPNIARVFDAGATPTGRPYFVMELVRGIPITEYCDAHHLTPGQRLELFVGVCHAVQHAHQKGIVHRDLKPSNVLVTLHDGRPVAKVIDFGIAKATSGPLTDKTLFTGFAQMIGTPLYMSPEQASMSGLDVDTRTDVYSLGVLLYELLTGTTPFDRSRLKEAALDEIRRIIREEEPARPSTRLSTEQTLPSVAANRGMEPARLTRLVRGDLDWIVMKALEKDRSRRYETANGLAMDVQRHLSGEAVLACPPSTLYRLRKLVGKHRGAVLAAAAVVVALAAGVVGTGLGLVRAERARADEAARAEGERRAKQRAEANLTIAIDAVEKYLATVTDDPGLRQADFLALRKRLLESAVPFFRRIADEKSDDPQVEGRRGMALNGLAHVRWALGEHEAALQDFEASREVLAELDARHPDTAAYRHALGRVQADRASYLQALGRLEAAEAGVAEGLALLEPRASRPDADIADRRNLAILLQCRSDQLQLRGKTAEAEVPLRRCLELRTRILDESKDAWDRALWAEGQKRLGSFLWNSARYLEAEAAYRAASNTWKGLAGPSYAEAEIDYQSGVLQHEIGKTVWRLERVAEAEAAFREAIATFERLADRFPTVAVYAEDLGHAYSYLGMLQHRTDRAQASLESLDKAIARLQAVMDREPRLTRGRDYLGVAHTERAIALLALERYAEAREATEKSLAVLQDLAARAPGESPMNAREGEATHRMAIANGYFNLADALARMRKIAEAEAAYREALRWYEGLVADWVDGPIGRRDLAVCHQELGRLLAESNRLEEAEKEFREALRLKEQLVADVPSATEFTRMRLHAMSQLGALLLLRKEFTEAEPMLREVVDAFRSLVDQSPRDRSLRSRLAANLNSLGWLHQAAGGLAAGEAKLREAASLYEQLLAESPLDADSRSILVRTQNNLQLVLAAQGKVEEGDAALRAAMAIREKLVAASPDCAVCLEALCASWLEFGAASLASGRAPEALGWFDRGIAGLEPLVARDAGTPNTSWFLHGGYWGRAETLRSLGRNDEALKSLQETLPRADADLGPVHVQTLACVASLARTFLALGRGAEAVALVDDRVGRAAGAGVDADVLDDLLDIRLRRFQAAGDGAACRQTAEMRERLAPSTVMGLYNAACCRAVTAAVFRASGAPDAAKDADDEADRAMAWLGRAVAAGYDDLAAIGKDSDLDALRDREDFRALEASKPSPVGRPVR